MGPLQLANGTYLQLAAKSGGATVSLTPYSARGITQSLEVISGGGGTGGQWLRRDVNGWLRDFSDARFRKYRSTVTCRDGESPCIDNTWIGEEVTVECAYELSFPTGASPGRPMVPGSARVQGSITYYRPQLTMRVSGVKTSFSEYPGLYSWELILEEF